MNIEIGDKVFCTRKVDNGGFHYKPLPDGKFEKMESDGYPYSFEGKVREINGDILIIDGETMRSSVWRKNVVKVEKKK